MVFDEFGFFVLKECCLKVHSKCESCMMKTIEVLRSISGKVFMLAAKK